MLELSDIRPHLYLGRKKSWKDGKLLGASIQVCVGLTMDVFTLPSVVAGMEYPRPIGIMAQE